MKEAIRMAIEYEDVFGVQPGVLNCAIAGNNEDIFRPSSFRFLPPDANPDPESTQISSLPLIIAALEFMITFELIEIPEDLRKRIKQFGDIFEGSTGAASLPADDAFGFDQISFKLEDLTDSEEKFSAKMDNLVTSAIRGTTVDLDRIAQIHEPFFILIADPVYLDYCSTPAFILKSELIHKLRTLVTFLFRLRVSVAQAHNRLAGGDPFRTLNVNQVNDYVNDPFNAHIVAPKLFMDLWEVIEEILVESAEEKTIQELGSFSERMRDPNRAIQLKSHFFDAMLDVLSELHGVSNSVLNGVLEMRLPRDKITNFVELVESWERYWLSATPMGLCWRLLKELEYLDNYRYVPHWIEVEILSIESNELLVEGDYAKMDAMLGKR
jgi:hypothetical protein